MPGSDDFIPYMGYLWLQVEDDTVTIGLSEDGIAELSDITAVKLPTESEEVAPDEICGEIETDEGVLNLYSPVEGKVIEINPAVVENPSLIMEDPHGEAWLFRVEPNNADDLDDLSQASSGED